MPINESLGRPSNLTQKQQREAMEAIYGIPKESMSPIADLTVEDRVRLRRLLDTLDQRENAGVKEFDLNNPPRAPYVYKEFPFLMYNAAGESKAAHNPAERQAMYEAGWSDDPAGPAPRAEIELSEAERAESEAVDRQLIKKRRP